MYHNQKYQPLWKYSYCKSFVSDYIVKADGYIEEKNGNKYFTFAPTDKNKEVLTKYAELWDEIE